MPGDRRQAKRFDIDCPVTVSILVRGRTRALERGQLNDIGVSGARFYLDRQLGVGTHLILHVHFSNPKEGVTTVRFEGTVSRARPGPPHEIAVRFRRGGRFLREGLGDLFRTQQSA